MVVAAVLSRSAVVTAPTATAAFNVPASRRFNLLHSARPAAFRRGASAKLQSSSAQEAISELLAEAEVVVDSITPVGDGNGVGSGLTIGQTKQLIDFMCNETEFAEVELKMGDSYSVRIKRASPVSSSVQIGHFTAGGGVDNSAAALDGSAKIMPAAPPAAETAAALSVEPESGERGDKPFYGSDASAESISLTINSNKVGILRLGPIVKGVAGKPLISVGDTVRSGQKVAYVEQLGTLEPITAQERGEVVRVLLEDGAPLEYGQPIFEVAPGFVGIKRGAE